MRNQMEVKVNSLKAWLLASRPKTLAAAVAPVMVGLALAYNYYPSIRWVPALACLFFAMMMQIAANLINDLYDFLKGSDGEDRLGPLRATAQGWITPSAMKKGIFVVVALACLVGSTLIFYAGWEMVLVGAFCAVFAYFYTSGPYPLAYNGLGDVAVVVFFGIVAVGFTNYVQWLHWSSLVTGIGLMTGVVVNTLLILNNYRDRDTDKKSGKRTVVVLLGEAFGRYFYLASGLMAAFFAFGLIAFNLFGEEKLSFPYGIYLSLSFLAYSFLHVSTWRKLSKIREGVALNALIAETSRNMLVFSLLVSIDLVLLR